MAEVRREFIMRIAARVADDDPRFIEGESLADLLLDLQHFRSMVDAFERDALVRFDGERSWAADGSRSAAGWVSERTHSARGRLAGQLKVGRALLQLPEAEAEARAGRLTSEQCRLLAGTLAPTTAEAAVRDQACLVGWARDLRPKELAAKLRAWAGEVAPSDNLGTGPAEAEPEGINLYQGLNGRWQLQGELSTADGELLSAALDAEVDRRLRARRNGDVLDDGRSIEAIRGHAFVDLIAQGMRHEPSDASAPDRYRVGLVFTPEQFAAAKSNHLACCDSVMFRAVVNAAGEVLDIGRSTRKWSNGIRRAITLRDGGCRFPGCDRPPSWADVHHCQPWENGGKTSVKNGILLCRGHHTFIHNNGWSVRVVNGKGEFRKPDGTLHHLRNRAPNLFAHAA